MKKIEEKFSENKINHLRKMYKKFYLNNVDEAKREERNEINVQKAKERLLKIYHS